MDEVIQKIIAEDATFADAKFKSKIENMFVQIKLSVVTGKPEKVRHFVNDETYDKITSKIQNDRANGKIQMYDELNVASIDIVDAKELEDSFEITVNLYSKAYDYYIDLNTRKYLSGDTKDRLEKNNTIVLSKVKKAKALGNARKCPCCGANIDVNKTGVCEYCGSTFELKNYDWVITYMEI